MSQQEKPQTRLQISVVPLPDSLYRVVIEGRTTVDFIIAREDFFALRSVIRSGVQDPSLGVKFYDPIQVELPPKMKGD